MDMKITLPDFFFCSVFRGADIDAGGVEIPRPPSPNGEVDFGLGPTESIFAGDLGVWAGSTRDGGCEAHDGGGEAGSGLERIANCFLASRLFGLMVITRRKQYSRCSAVETHSPSIYHPFSDCGYSLTSCAKMENARARSPDLKAETPILRISSSDKGLSMNKK